MDKHAPSRRRRTTPGRLPSGCCGRRRRFKSNNRCVLLVPNSTSSHSNSSSSSSNTRLINTHQVGDAARLQEGGLLDVAVAVKESNHNIAVLLLVPNSTSNHSSSSTK